MLCAGQVPHECAPDSDTGVRRIAGAGRGISALAAGPCLVVGGS